MEDKKLPKWLIILWFIILTLGTIYHVYQLSQGDVPLESIMIEDL